LRENTVQDWKAYGQITLEKALVAKRVGSLLKDEIMGRLLFSEVKLSPLDRTVNKDMTIEVDEEEIHLLTTPGHWKAGISLYLPSTKVLFKRYTLLHVACAPPIEKHFVLGGL